MKTKLILTTLIVAFSFLLQITAQEYPKVILRGDYPDPTIIREGADYYMTHSPFVYSPGFLIWHSKDLVNWEPVCRAMTEAKGSAFAPDLVKYKDKYYIYFPAAGTNWVIWASNIKGPWSRPIDLKVGNIDPGHIVGEEGKRYLFLSGGNMVQLSDDGLSTVGEVKKVYDGWKFPDHWITEGMWLESPKLFKKGDYFYLTVAEGGTAGPATSHMIVSARSKSIFGPWENSPYNPIVHTYSADEYWWSKGHGTLIDDVNGNWWVVYHAYENGFHTLGRQTLLEPVQWMEDGWYRSVKRVTPVANSETSIESGMELSDNFSGKNPGLQWTTWNKLDAAKVSLKNNSLYLSGKGSGPKDAQLLLATATDKSYETQVEVTLSNGSTGGLLLFYNEKAFAGVSSNGKQFTVYENAGKQTTKPNSLGNHFFLKTKNAHNLCDILVSRDNLTWETLYTGLDVSGMHHNNYGGFYALRIGLMAAGKASVKFNNFQYKPLEGYLFAYFTDKASNTNGLHLAWSNDGYKWTGIGPEHSFLKNDYGPWGVEKKMRDPFIMQGPDGLYHCLWTINWNADIIGYASSRDLIHWSRQSYIPVMEGFEVKNCWAPEMIYDDAKQQYVIFWSSTIKVNGEWKTEPGYKYDHRIYCTTTKDFKTFTPARIFFDPGHNVIDSTIRKAGDKYIMIYKDERELPTPAKNLLVAVSDNAEGPYKTISEKPFTKNWVEGPAINQLPDSSFIVYMDAYREHKYEAKTTRDFINWEDVSGKISFPAGTKHGSVIKVPMDFIDNLMFEQKDAERKNRELQSKEGVLAPKPVFRDTVYDGAADPIVIWNSKVSKWWMFYTNRRVKMTELPGVSWVFGTPIGIAESADGANWKYLGTANFNNLPDECGGKDATFWAPDIVWGDDGKWHMYLSIQPGIDVKWGLPGFIAHLTSTNLRDWKYESRLSQLGTHVLDADILKMPDGTWRLYYKASKPYSNISMIESKDLFSWSEPKEVLKISGEGPIAFTWKNYFWLVIDTWNGQTVYRSADGNTWERQPGNPLLPDGEGTGPDDIPNALHANVVISNNRAYLYYFTHPGRIGENKKKDTYEQRRTSVQVVELEMNREGWLTANRNKPTYVQLLPPTPVNVSIQADFNRSKKISENLIGIFFEDINYAADGGLYGELIQNRSFEYQPSDVGRDSTWNSFKSWQLLNFDKAKGSYRIDTVSPIHRNNPHYAVIGIEEPGKGSGIANLGYDGIVVKAGEKYDFSMLARVLSGKKSTVNVRLTSNGEVIATSETEISSQSWNKVKTTLTATKSVNNAQLEVVFNKKGKYAVDMISLFPQKTFKNRPNGLRADLAQTIADLHPKFVRFPGGCVAHGNGLENMYRWKNTVGPVEQRLEQKNIWRYRQSAGLGYFEYFQFCEDIGAMPLPVLPAAVCCQNSANGGQKGIPMCDMDEYVHEVLDLIEYANGDASTKWGKMRADAGHPDPFNLKYIGIGNEDLISDTFEERFTMIYNAVKEKHPKITIVGTAGPFCEGTDYVEGWKIADRLKVPVIDEHYYQQPGWFINNQNFYDNYPRNRSKVYLGEYASWGNTLNNALAEAAYMTSLERNGDIVSMASYAPLLAKEKHTQWGTDLIFFNNEEIKPTPNYYVQQFFGQNSGDTYIPGQISLENPDPVVEKRIASSIIKDSKTGDLIIKLVNLLPGTVNAKLNLGDYLKTDSKAVKAVLSGLPEDRNVKPQASEIKIGKEFNYELPAYSVSVIRIKAMNQ